MNIKTFKDIDSAIDFIIINIGLQINQFTQIVRELEEKSAIKIDDIYILIDERGLLD
jgi:hypothetical protein